MTNEPSHIPPQAFAPIIIEADPVRCQCCNRMLAELATAPWCIKCSRCGALNWTTADGTPHATEPTKATKAIKAEIQEEVQDGSVHRVAGTQHHLR